MVKRMLVDATHPEETRVVILNGTRLEEFDFETSTKRQLKGNIYLAKVTRVEPSLQAAFVEFGGNRHGFLAFSEIHPDYYQIPVADRMALLAEQEHDLKQSAEVEDAPEHREPLGEHPVEHHWEPETIAPEQPAVADESAEPGHEPSTLPDTPSADPGFAADEQLHRDHPPQDTEPYPAGYEPPTSAESADAIAANGETALVPSEVPSEQPDIAAANGAQPARARSHYEEVGGDDQEDTQEAMAARRKARSYRHRYKIQEVIKRRQILLVQVVKEERGTKGAALTTYLSLAGRYCVLMPNTSRGGGVSRRIPSASDRKRLKECMDEMEVPEGMAVILRTAAVERSKAEIKRDFEYLLRQWDNVRELTLQSVAPTLVYEEASLIKRAIRDLYLKDIDEVLVEGDDGYRMAKEFMRVLMPSHAKKVQLYSDPEIPLFHRYQVETQLDAMHSPTVNLKSGGYIVINPTEALVAIDVNSGRATRERNIEETAYKTNLEAAEEIARQLRLRDLGGLIVIDFIDMEDQRNVHTVEKRLKEAMKADRARIQIGRISPFGLLELSRQRLRPSLLEASTERCPYCAGSGMIRSTESTALHVLRSVEEEGIRHRTAEVALTLPPTVALYILNQKRARLNEIEQRYHFTVRVTIDDALIPPAFKLERVRARELPPPGSERPAPIAAGAVEMPSPAEIDEAIEAVAEPVEVEEEIAEATESPREEGEHGEEHRGRRRRRRGRRGGRDERGERGERGERTERGEQRAERGERGPREERGERAERGEGPREPRREFPPRERFPMTPADVGAMLDGRPVPALDEDDEDVQPGNGAPEGESRPHEGHGGDDALGPDGQPRRRRRRGRRGGRRRRRQWEEGTQSEGEQPALAEGHEHAESRAEDHREHSRGGESSEAREPPQERAPETPAPRAARPEPRRESPASEPQSAPEPEAPSGPPRKGWWQRFTS